MPLLPEPRGPVSALLVEHLGPEVAPLPAVSFAAPADPLGDEDLHLALYIAYELHYRGFDGVDDAWEWEPSLLTLRGRLERCFEDAVVETAGPPGPTAAPEEMDLALREIADGDDAPALSRYVETRATLEQVREFLMHKSAYQLKEADPHSFALPRLSGAPKAAFVAIQADEYGAGRAERLHATLFAKTLRAAGLDDAYGAHVDRLPGSTLASGNLMSLFGLHRRWRAAAAGHLALFEMTSSVPSGRYARGLARVGLGPDATDFFEEHVVADAVHENLAAVDLAGGLARQDPALGADALFGARALLAVEGRFARDVFGAWEAGESSLRAPSRDRAGSVR